MTKIPLCTANWNCDGDKCTDSKGEVRTYPLGGGANLILCRACWEFENSYRRRRVTTAEPQQDWHKAKVYGSE